MNRAREGTGFCKGQKHQAQRYSYHTAKAHLFASHAAPRAGRAHGRHQKLNRDKQGDEKREKRHFQLDCNLSDFSLLLTTETQLPDVRQQPLPRPPPLHLFSRSFRKEDSAFSRPGWFSRCPGNNGSKIGKKEGKKG